MKMHVLPRADVAYLDPLLLDAQGLPRPVAADRLSDVPPGHIQQWCVQHAVYQVITEELVAWLAARCAGKRAIEVCAGFGTLGRALGIPRTDSYMQTRPTIRAYYRMLRQPIIEPPPDVEMLDANAAVRKYEPEVVIAAWATQRYREGTGNGSEEGVDEEAILDTGATYILIGNTDSHGDKRIMARPHTLLRFPWLVSRAFNPHQNMIAVWPKGAEA